MPLFILLLMFVLLSGGSKALAGDLVGKASIVDGDTLEIHSTRIRLWGIDAPESSQLCRDEESLPYFCGAKAANELDAFIAQRPVDCVPVNRDVYGRIVAMCSVGELDLAEWLVRSGLALDWPRYSNGRYASVERGAEGAARGIWSGSHVKPWIFRRCMRGGGDPKRCSDGD